jgi:hypothetical protein
MYGSAPGTKPSGLKIISPLGYLDFLKLMARRRSSCRTTAASRKDTIMGVACMTLRETTERHYTIELGTNRLVRPTAVHPRRPSMLPQTRPRVAGAQRVDDGRPARASPRFS